jgi:heme-degrading monooxygenase HmoA
MVKGGSDMWAQLMRWRLKPGKDLAGLREQLQAVEQPDSGLLRTMIMQDQKDPDQYFTLVVFESEEKARARERDPRRQEGVQALRAMLADILAAPPEFTDLAVVEEWTG